ncbi:MAG: EamA family transporter RarD [Maricaulaceae bacterium]|jgi:chloramphenicol-sensitive protein RarD
MSTHASSQVPPSAPPQHAAPLDAVGFAAATSAFVIWGVMPLYFRAAAPVGPLELVFHRAIWALVVMFLALALAGRLRAAVTALTTPKVVRVLAVTAGLIAGNWLLFIAAVQTDRVLEASLAYFINPMMSVALGAVLLRERMSSMMLIAVGAAAAGVVNQAIVVGEPPFYAMALAALFAVYGYLRKTVAVEAAVGLFAEMLILTPFAVAGVAWLEFSGAGHALSALRVSLLLVFAGPLSAVPLFLFATGARRLPLFMIGLLQFIAPSMQFVTALWLGEPFTPAHVITFGLIWTGLVLMSLDAVRQDRAARRRRAATDGEAGRSGAA